MILYDGVIYRLQDGGGISVLFNELLSRLPVGSHSLVVPDLKRYLDRYRNFKVASKFDIFHSTYYRLPSSTPGKVVTTVHDFTYERYVKGGRKWVHAWQKNRAIANADKIICVSESTKNDLLHYCGSHYEDRVVVVQNGVSTDYCKLPDVSACSQVLFVGARGGYKNFSPTVQAIAALKDLQLVCVGGGGFTPEELRFLESRIPGRYSHSGFLTNSKLNEEYNKSICLAYTSLYEGFGIPVLEAMRAGCPVVAVDASSIPEVSGDAAYLLEAGAMEEIRMAIDFFCVDENRKIYIERGFSQAKKFSWDSTFNNTVAVYEELLGRKLAKDV